MDTLTPQDEDFVWTMVEKVFGEARFEQYPSTNDRGMTFSVEVPPSLEEAQEGEMMLDRKGITLQWHDDTTLTATLR